MRPSIEHTARRHTLPLSRGRFADAIILRSVVRDCCRAVVHVQSHRTLTRTSTRCCHRSHSRPKASSAVWAIIPRGCLPTLSSAARTFYTLPNVAMPRACANGCGWTEFGTHSTCCTRCKGASGPHTRDCHTKNAKVAGDVSAPAGVHTCIPTCTGSLSKHAFKALHPHA